MRQQLSGWGRYPVETCNVFRPEKPEGLSSLFLSGAQLSYISRGLGRSYGDVALNSERGVISQLKANRFLGFDVETATLKCEAGVSLAEIIEQFLPRGFLLPVSPGTKFVTIGGAIANDIHGKNHHRDGSIGNFVESLTLLTPRGEQISCSPSENSEVFWATVGGLGLTGIILDATIKLRRAESAYFKVDYQKAANLDEAFKLLTSAEDDRYHYSVAWIDCLSVGSALGRAVMMRGNHAAARDLPASIKEPLAQSAGTQWSVPFDFPSLTLNQYTLKIFNALFYRTHGNSLAQLVSLEKYFYPLDRILHWNRLYGRRGFLQYQVVFPSASSYEGLSALLERLSRARKSSFLAVLKRFGPANRGLLSFPREGLTLALDLPFADDLPAFLQETDELVLRYGGRVYLAKDAVLHPDMFAQMYPGLKEFQVVKERCDPDGLLASSMSRRLRIT